MRHPLPGEIVKVSNKLTRTVVNADGSAGPVRLSLLADSGG
jgi:hypothetical protein